jgi:hypothetical protein
MRRQVGEEVLLRCGRPGRRGHATADFSGCAKLTLGSETSTHFNQTPGLYPKENTLHQQHGESLKTKIIKII